MYDIVENSVSINQIIQIKLLPWIKIYYQNIEAIGLI